ncbi:ATP-binding protein [Streptomyces zingiberis]|uniref:ATP-binding protein n=1 Tax=Streptomyces zingiberis TaxID=2053010 RepID=A0ABX1C5U0_9ACTN|nr:ATP-binding protein [Streptomyces zingiberis]NJQ03277.1 ATP-binding protein [Streptomyces zingiberis]
MTAPSPHDAPVTVRTFTRRFDATPRGVRLARRHLTRLLDAWGIPRGSERSDAAALVVAELGANAVTHGLVPGRLFELRAGLCAATLVIEVSDARGERRPPAPGAAPAPGPDAESGRGLLLVAAVADRWSVLDRRGPGKTVRVELDLPG